MESSLLHADIFFFVTTVVTVAAGLLLLVILAYVIGILRAVRRMSKQAERGVDAIAEGLREAKDSIKEDGVVATAAKAFFSTLHKHQKKKGK